MTNKVPSPANTLLLKSLCLAINMPSSNPFFGTAQCTMCVGLDYSDAITRARIIADPLDHHRPAVYAICTIEHTFVIAPVPARATGYSAKLLLLPRGDMTA